MLQALGQALTPITCMCRAQYAKIVQKLGFEAHFKDFKVQNIVGSCDVKFPIRLEGLSYTHSMFSSVRRPLTQIPLQSSLTRCTNVLVSARSCCKDLHG